MLEKAVHELLKGFSGGRVHPMRADQNSAVPFVVFQRTDSDRWREINGPTGMTQVYVQIDVYDTAYYAAKELGTLIEKALDGFRGTVYYGTNTPQDFVRIAGISAQNDLMIFDQTDETFLYRSTASYLITHEQ